MNVRTLFAVGDGFLDGSGEVFDQLAETTDEALPGDWSIPVLDRGTLEERRATLPVVGGATDRLPLACVKSGLVDYAEKLFYARPGQEITHGPAGPLVGYRTFRRSSQDPPFRSAQMASFLSTVGAPDMLAVFGLGVDAEILAACDRSFKLYYSGDCPPLRVPAEVSKYFDLILVGEQWQKDVVLARHPEASVAFLPRGPEFADPETFRPLNTAKEYDVVYVAAARDYKRHDVLFEALARYPGRLRCLCVSGHGNKRERIEEMATSRGLDVTFVGPPGVSPPQVNELMNKARIGIVAGVNDGCPAVITEYMLAGLPVVANANLRCGTRYITPETGVLAKPETFHEAIGEVLARRDEFTPRTYAMEHWTWPVSVSRLKRTLREAGYPC